MSFSIQSLLAFTTSVAIALAPATSEEGGYLAIAFLACAPFVMMIIAITSPQRGNQLDPSRRWYLFFIAKTWMFLIGLLLSVFLFYTALDYLPDRVTRAIDGDFFKRVVGIRVLMEIDETKIDSVLQKDVFDSIGYIGVVRRAHPHGNFSRVGLPEMEHEYYFYISTDRDDLGDSNKTNRITIRPDGTLYLED
jgi:hypothetical protein